MTGIVILGDGPLGQAVETAARARGSATSVRGRPAHGRHPADAFPGASIVVEASRGDAVLANVEAMLEAGVERAVIATSAWEADRAAVDERLRAAGAVAVASSNFSIGVALFGRVVELAAELFGRVDGFDPFLVEWHRAGKRDRPSGTALDLAGRVTRADPRLKAPGSLEVVSVRAGSAPGMHLVGFDAAGETVELRLTARDRSAYAAGILASADWLGLAPREPGLHGFDAVVDELLGRVEVAA